ncbi:MAG TPA: hypothetical protein VLI94_11700 [Solirubrobacterales bacterium]|nr:hypothetical protein [Solirubrobacterales bacterium]
MHEPYCGKVANRSLQCIALGEAAVIASQFPSQLRDRQPRRVQIEQLPQYG